MTTKLTSNQMTHNGAELATVLEAKISIKAISEQFWDPANVNANSVLATSFTVTGAAMGDVVLASFTLSLGNLVLGAYVSNTNTVTVTLTNDTGGPINLAAGYLRLILI